LSKRFYLETTHALTCVDGVFPEQSIRILISPTFTERCDDFRQGELRLISQVDAAFLKLQWTDLNYPWLFRPFHDTFVHRDDAHYYILRQVQADGPDCQIVLWSRAGILTRRCLVAPHDSLTGLSQESRHHQNEMAPTAVLMCCVVDR
jgi:hypothetical protein